MLITVPQGALYRFCALYPWCCLSLPEKSCQAADKVRASGEVCNLTNEHHLVQQNGSLVP